MENIPETNMDMRADIVEDFYSIFQRSLASAALFEDILHKLANKEGDNEV